MTVERYGRSCRFSAWLVGCAALSLAALSSPGNAQKSVSARTPASAVSSPFDNAVLYDPRAALLLKRMGDAYARLGAFDLRIDISSALIPLTTVPDATSHSTANANPTPFHVDEATLRRQSHLHLAFRSSNHLLIETEQSDAVTGKPFDVRWVCDGQNFWSYTGDKKIYTREKAPSSIHDFARLKYLNGGTLELMMLIGPNPFADLLQTVDGAHRIGETDVRGVAVEIVSLQIDDPLEQSELRLYIGKEDSLLHRMEIESIPIKLHDGLIKVGSKLDALIEDTKPPPIQQNDDPTISGVPDGSVQEPPPPPPKPVGSFVRFENDLQLVPTFAPGTFTFTPPKDALMLGDQGPMRHLTMKQRIAQMAKNIRQKRAQMLRNNQN